MAEESLAAGTRLGAFEVIRLLGHGGMGAVYEVRNVLTERRLALKVILPTHLADPDARARFLREVRIAAAIDHPNVVRVFELALHGDTMLLPMELVEGVTLRQHLTGEDERARRLPVAEMVSLLVQVCEGVAAVHAKGVIHRDLKPANVMVAQGEKAERVAKVLDFGAARHIDRHDEHTRAGLALGTPPYMAPEQLAAAPDLDARVDVYALGVIAYEALVGQRPHGASGGAEVMAKVFTQAPFPRPRAVRGDLPDALDHAVMHALAFARDERTLSVVALRDALRAALVPAPRELGDPVSELRSAELVVERPTAPLRPRPATGPLRAGGALAALALSLVGFAAALRATRGPAPPTVPGFATPGAVAAPARVVADVPVAQRLLPHPAPAEVVAVDAGDEHRDAVASVAAAPADATSRPRTRRRLPQWAR